MTDKSDQEPSGSRRTDLVRMQEQSEKVFGGGAQPEYDDTDPATVWGKRIGRALGLLLATYFVWELYSTYFRS